MSAARPVIMFACVHNSGRSVAAEVLARHHGGDRIVVRSAGSDPASTVNPAVAAVLAQRGTPVTDHTPTLLAWELVEQADVVITMGCGETCPVVPGKTYQDWSIEDPAGQDLETVRAIVEDIDTRVRALLAQLDSHVSPAGGRAEPSHDARSPADRARQAPGGPRPPRP